MDKLLSDTPHFDNLLLEKTISYAQKIGWQQVPHPNQNIILFQRSTDELDRPVQLILPSSATFWDSSILLDKAIKLLAASEDTSSQETIAAIQSENNFIEAIKSASNPSKAKSLIQKIIEAVRSASYPSKVESLVQKNINFFYLSKQEFPRLFSNSSAMKAVEINQKIREKRTRQAPYRGRVDKHGNIIISARYTQAIRLKPGDEFEVKLSSKQILLSRRKNLGIQAPYRGRVDKRGQITISAKYTQIMGLKPGDEFEVKLSSKQILLCHLERTGNKQPINQSDRT
ncbi:AbrB-like transcriptional regulator [Synechocystis sp. PCC 7509]|uniref:AbrB-like transcriptional regulator n=1 Tax=Synechocystis sp. PCC 7509 TaxID=927677 RepID=UPI0002AD1365|nr:AbrB-like transcriptional regulator [Synechocystis sp. PCC 7509]